MCVSIRWLLILSGDNKIVLTDNWVMSLHNCPRELSWVTDLIHTHKIYSAPEATVLHEQATWLF